MSNKTRKVTVWTRDKIARLIHLYKKNECLWNYLSDQYKSKDHRQRAIESICNTLRISKCDFSKKIHNLRNQFNSEMKKMSVRIIESGENPEDPETLKILGHCRWEHFEALKFLRKVIEPRPGYQNNGTFPPPKKFRLKYEENEAKLSQSTNSKLTTGDLVYHLEESTETSETLECNGEDFQEFETVDEDSVAMERDTTFDQKYNSTITNRTPRTNSIKATEASVPNNNFFTNTNTKHQQHMQIHIEDTPQFNTGAVIELSSSNNGSNTINTPRDHMNSSIATNVVPRDQWDTFGELIANEFRLLHSDLSRKKLKRKIMQDILSIGEEDDNLTKPCNTNS